MTIVAIAGLWSVPAFGTTFDPTFGPTIVTTNIGTIRPGFPCLFNTESAVINWQSIHGFALVLNGQMGVVLHCHVKA